MPESIEAVLQVSEQDRILHTNKKYLNAIPEKKKNLRIPVRKVEMHLDKLKMKEEELYGRIREREILVQVENEKIKKSDGKMLSVKNQKEYMASQKEIEIAKKNIKKVEDQILELEEQKETVSMELAKVLEEYRQEKAVVSEAEKLILEEEQGLLDIIETCEKIKNEAISKISEELLVSYQHLLKRKMIPAAVEISSSSCMGCAMAIPAQLFNEVIRDLNGVCPHCGRLLFYKAPEKAKEDPKAKSKKKAAKKAKKK